MTDDEKQLRDLRRQAREEQAKIEEDAAVDRLAALEKYEREVDAENKRFALKRQAVDEAIEECQARHDERIRQIFREEIEKALSVK